LDQLQLEAKPILSDGDLLAYNWEDHSLRLKPGLGRTLSERFRKSTVVPFVVIAEGQRCYQGAFLTGISSYLPGTPVIEIDIWRHKAEDVVQISPPPFRKPGEQAVDPRNDPRVKTALQRAGLLRGGEKTRPATKEEAWADEAAAGLALTDLTTSQRDALHGYLGRWRGTAIDKPEDGTSRDAIAMAFRVTEAGQLRGQVWDSYVGNRTQAIEELNVEDQRIRFEVRHRTGVTMEVTLRREGERLRGESVPIDADEDRCDLSLQRVSN
jgi:hypothetical protein